MTEHIQSGASILERMIAESGIDFHENVTSTNFPVTAEPDVHEEMIFIMFDPGSIYQQIVHTLDKMELVPAEIEYLTNYSKKKERKFFPLAALGSVWNHPKGFRCCAYLCAGSRDTDPIYLTAGSFDTPTETRFYILARKKRMM